MKWIIEVRRSGRWYQAGEPFETKGEAEERAGAFRLYCAIMGLPNGNDAIRVNGVGRA